MFEIKPTRGTGPVNIATNQPKFFLSLYSTSSILSRAFGDCASSLSASTATPPPSSRAPSPPALETFFFVHFRPRRPQKYITILTNHRTTWNATMTRPTVTIVSKQSISTFPFRFWICFFFIYLISFVFAVHLSFFFGPPR